MDAVVALAFALLILLLSGGFSCRFNVDSSPTKSYTCIERSDIQLMDKKYPCTEAEFKAQ